jgi:hypothetical protein
LRECKAWLWLKSLLQIGNGLINSDRLSLDPGEKEGYREDDQDGATK